MDGGRTPERSYTPEPLRRRSSQLVLSDLKDHRSPNYRVVPEVIRADLVHEEGLFLIG